MDPALESPAPGPPGPSGSSQQLHLLLAGALALVSTLNYIIADATNVLALVVANTILSNSYVWNLVTSPFFETNPIKLICDAALLFFAFKNVSYPNIEHFCYFLGISVLSSTILASTFCILSYFATADPKTIVAPMHGFGGVLTAIFTYVRQYKSNKEPIVGAITFHNLPVLILTAEAVVYSSGYGFYTRDLSFVVITLFFSWSYLRFYAKGITGEVGNPSESFSFVAMFPELLHIVLVPLFTAFYNIMAIVGLYPKLAEAEKRLPHHLRFDTKPLVAGVAGGSPVTTAPAATKNAAEVAMERRRAKALKLLDAKMAELSSKEEDGAWGDDDDKDEK